MCSSYRGFTVSMYPYKWTSLRTIYLTILARCNVKPHAFCWILHNLSTKPSQKQNKTYTTTKSKQTKRNPRAFQLRGKFPFFQHKALCLCLWRKRKEKNWFGTTITGPVSQRSNFNHENFNILTLNCPWQRFLFEQKAFNLETWLKLVLQQ